MALLLEGKRAFVSGGTRGIGALSLPQTVLMRDYFNSLLDMAVQLHSGEVDLATISNNTVHVRENDSGLISFIRDLLEVDISVKQLEANTNAKNAKTTKMLSIG